MQRMSETIKPPRTAWGNFPDVLIHASKSAVKQHPAYKAAKAGDGPSATILANDTMSDAFDALTELEARYLARTDTIDAIRNRIADFQ